MRHLDDFGRWLAGKLFSDPFNTRLCMAALAPAAVWTAVTLAVLALKSI